MSPVLPSAVTGRGEALSPVPRPASVLPGRDVPDFGVIRVGRCRVRHRVRTALRRRRRLLLAAAALCAAVAVAAPACAGRLPYAVPAASHTGAVSRATTSRPRVRAPVRIADPATVRLLRPGDRVDVLAADGDRETARTVARHARVRRIPEEAGRQRGSALVVLEVPRGAASRLAAAATHSRLSVTLW